MAKALRNGRRTQQLVWTQRTGNSRLEDIKFARIGRMSEQRCGRAKVLAQHLSRHVLDPVAQQECVVLVEITIVENQQEFASIGTKALDRMWNATGKIPEIADTDVIDKVSPLGVDSGDASGPIQHVGPFGLLVPMQFAHAACVQSHLHAGHRFRNTKFPLRHLSIPVARLGWITRSPVWAVAADALASIPPATAAVASISLRVSSPMCSLRPFFIDHRQNQWLTVHTGILC